MSRMSVVRIIFKIILLGCLLLTSKSGNDFKFKMTNIVCEIYNKSLAVLKECRLRAISRNKTTLTVLLNITRPVDHIFVRLKMLKKENGYKPWLIDYTFDFCKLMRKIYHPVAKIILDFSRKATTFNHSCPFEGINGIRDFYSIESLPIILPTGEYLMMLTWGVNETRLIHFNTYFTFWDNG